MVCLLSYNDSKLLLLLSVFLFVLLYDMLLYTAFLNSVLMLRVYVPVFDVFVVGTEFV